MMASHTFAIDKRRMEWLHPHSRPIKGVGDFIAGGTGKVVWITETSIVSFEY